MCDHRLNDGPLICTRDHDDDRGHTYAATVGSDLDNSSTPKRHATGDDQ